AKKLKKFFCDFCAFLWPTTFVPFVAPLRDKGCEQPRKDRGQNQEQDPQDNRNAPTLAATGACSTQVQSLCAQPESIKRRESDKTRDHEQNWMIRGRDENTKIILQRGLRVEYRV